MPSIRKHQPSLVAAISIPASDGPIKRARFTMDELMAIAFPRSARSPTICTMNACRPGMSKALIMPCITLRARINPMVMCPESVSAASASDWIMASVCVHTSTLPAVQPVNPNSSEGREQERRNLSRETDRAQQQRRSRQPVDQP